MSWLNRFAMVCGLTLLASNVRAAPDTGVVADELIAAGVTGEPAQLGEQLQAQARSQRVCAGEEVRACQQHLRTVVRQSQHLGKQLGAIDNPEKAVRVAAAVMLLAAEGNVTAAGEVVQAQLRNRWNADDILGAAQTMDNIQTRRRWRQQVMQLMRECATDGTCSAQQAHTAIAAMRRASQRADMDSRWARRTVSATLRDHRQDRTTNDVTTLEKTLHRRLKLSARFGGIAGTGHREQQRQSYRGRMDGEDRTGGSFGGNASSGPGNNNPGKGPGPN